jgi:hypothetical protein
MPDRPTLNLRTPTERPNYFETECPRLSSDLRQLIASADRQSFARQHGLYYQDNRIRIEIELVSDVGDLPERFGLQVEGKYLNYIQGLAPVDILCDLSNDSRVRAVRSPTPAAPASPY